jgi:competence protein ComGC
MKASSWNRKASALTLIETLVVVAVLAVLVAMLLPALLPPRRVSRVGCANNLKQVGIAFRLFATDNGDKYPMQVSVTNEGTMELVPSGAVFPHFQVMSNELSTPKILFCPADSSRTFATNFTSDFNDTHVSYFVGVDANETRPEMLLAGDRNITVKAVPLPHGLASLATNSPVGWSKKLHKNHGYIALADANVQAVDVRGLRELLRKSGVTNRLAIP